MPEVGLNWEMISAIGELLGAAAVVLSLAYLARQIAGSNRLARAEAWRSSIDNVNSINAAFGIDPEFRRVLNQVMIHGATRDDLSEEDRLLIGTYLISLANTYGQLAKEVEEGILAGHALEEWPTALFETPYFRSSWPVYRTLVAPGVVTHLSRLIEARTSGRDDGAS
jgi:hypothetical protein